MPMVVVMATTKTPMRIEILDPWMIRLKMSRPRWSVPEKMTNLPAFHPDGRRQPFEEVSLERVMWSQLGRKEGRQDPQDHNNAPDQGHLVPPETPEKIWEVFERSLTEQYALLLQSRDSFDASQSSIRGFSTYKEDPPRNSSK